MTAHNHRTLRKRDGYLPLSGSIVESIPTPTASALAQNSAATAGSDSTPSGIPLVGSSAAQNALTSAASSTPTTSATSSTSSANQISLGTVIGACVAALIALILALLLAFYCSRRHKKRKAYSRSRNVANNASRRRSHLEPWKRMDDKGDRLGGQAQPMQQRPPSGPLGAMFHRTVSNASAEKSSEGHNREEVGSMHHFAKYHPGLAVELASQGATAGVDDKVAKPSPVLHLPGRGSDMAPLSWDRDTVGGESYLSAQSDLSKSTTTPLMMATAKSTPPATTSFLHRWESAEVLHASQTGSDFAESRELQNPFSDSASSVKSIPRGQNPFFSGRDHTIRRTLLPSPHENPFADEHATRDSAAAIQSLIAALEAPMDRDGNDRIVSVQSSVYSRMTGDDGDSTIDFTAFPYPPTSRTNVR